MRICSESEFCWDEVFEEVVVVELSEERDEEGDRVREEPRWVVAVTEK